MEEGCVSLFRFGMFNSFSPFLIYCSEVQAIVKKEIPGRRGCRARGLSSGEQPPALLHHVVDKNPSRLFTLLIFRLSRDKDSAFFFPTFVHVSVEKKIVYKS